MPSYLIGALRHQAGLPFVDETNIDAFLAPAESEPDNCILFFTGDPKQRAETDDVAVVLPELLRTFQGRLRGAVIDRASEDGLKARFNVVVMPSLVVTRRDQPLGVLGKIRDWSDYIEKIGAWLSPDAPVLPPSGGPRVEITHAGKEIVR